MLFFVLLKEQQNGHSLTLQLFFHPRQKGLKLLKAVVFYDGCHIAKKLLQVMIAQSANLFKGQTLFVELLDVLLDRVAGRSSQFTDFLFADALRVEAKNLADPAHKDCFIGHGRCWFYFQHLHSLPVKQSPAISSNRWST
jgi:hypothetical protein